MPIVGTSSEKASGAIVILLLHTFYVFYKEFIQHPEFRGPNFNWWYPAQLAWGHYRMVRP